MNREELYEELVSEGTWASDSSPAPVVNPKEGAGAQKPASWSVIPRWVIMGLGRVMQIGAAKYDAFNYRDSNVSAMTYVDAIERHLQLWQDGEEIDEETGVSHLFSVMASCSILLDAQANGTMADNRPKTGRTRKFLDELTRLMATVPLPPKNPNAPSLRKRVVFNDQGSPN